MFTRVLSIDLLGGGGGGADIVAVAAIEFECSNVKTIGDFSLHWARQ